MTLSFHTHIYFIILFLNIISIVGAHIFDFFYQISGEQQHFQCRTRSLSEF